MLNQHNFWFSHWDFTLTRELALEVKISKWTRLGPPSSHNFLLGKYLDIYLKISNSKKLLGGPHN